MPLLILWARRQVTRPLRAFSKAAETFSREAEPAELPELGPREMQVAARAFNRMQNRIRMLMKERTEMLASIGHDLRTPITRLRLRAEFMDDPMRVAVTRDLDLMARSGGRRRWRISGMAGGPRRRPWRSASQTLSNGFVRTLRRAARPSISLPPTGLSSSGEPKTSSAR